MGREEAFVSTQVKVALLTHVRGDHISITDDYLSTGPHYSHLATKPHHSHPPSFTTTLNPPIALRYPHLTYADVAAGGVPGAEAEGHGGPPEVSDAEPHTSRYLPRRQHQLLAHEAAVLGKDVRRQLEVDALLRPRV